MRKKMQLVSAVAFGLYGLASAQSAGPLKALRAPTAPNQMLGAVGAALPPSLGGSLTQQLTRAALVIHDQAPLWPVESAGTAKATMTRAAALQPTAANPAAPKAVQAASVTSAAVMNTAPLPINLASLPQLPSAALIELVASQIVWPIQTAQLKPAQAKPAQTQVAPARIAPIKASEAVESVPAHLQKQLEISVAVSQVAAAAAQTALQVTPPVAAPKPPVKVQTAKGQPIRSQPIRSQIAAPRPLPTKTQVIASSPATSPVVRKPQRRGYSRIIKATAYSSDVAQTDNSPFITATGTRVRPGVIALSRDLLRIFPYGSRVTLQDSAGLLNGRTFIVEDTMNVRMVNTVDIWMGSRAQAYQWGARSVTITAVR